MLALHSGSAFAELPNVPVVDFGDDLCWHGGTSGLPLYRAESAVRLFQGSPDGANPVDVDGDGQTLDDSIAYYPFSLETNFNPEGTFYNHKGNNTRFYGGAVTFWANRKPNWQEGGINIDHELRDDLNLHSYAKEGGDVGLRTYGLWLWQKTDFLNGGDRFPVSANAGSRIGVYISRYWKDYEEGRFVVRDGSDFYISEHAFSGETHTLQEVELLKTRWASYHPAAPYAIAFDADAATFEYREFHDIQAAGWYVAKPSLSSASLWLKWYAFALEAVVHRPPAASHVLQMRPMGAKGAISEEPVSYADWRNIYRWVNRNQYSLFKGYVFDRDGDMGRMFLEEGSFSGEDPGTDITWYDALAWANATSTRSTAKPARWPGKAKRMALTNLPVVETGVTVSFFPLKLAPCSTPMCRMLLSASVEASIRSRIPIRSAPAPKTPPNRPLPMPLPMMSIIPSP